MSVSSAHKGLRGTFTHHADYAVLLVPSRVFKAVQIVARLAIAVLFRHTRLLDVPLVREVAYVDSVPDRVQLSGHGRDPNDTNGAGGLRFGRCDECRRQQVGEQKVAEAVGAKLEVVALGSLLVGRRKHDAGVVEQHMQLVFFGGEGLDGGLDAAQVAEVEG